MPEPRYGIDDLADLGGVSRRTVRYYVQEGLLPPPLGVGRGPHYTREHLDRLLQVKTLQEAGRTLDEIRHVVQITKTRVAAEARSASALRSPADVPSTAPLSDAFLPSVPARTLWRRLTLAPGVELHVASDVRLPSPSRLHELAAWCRRYLPSGQIKSEDDNA